MKTFLFILMGIIIFDIFLALLMLAAVTKEEYEEFKEYMKEITKKGGFS